MHSCAELSAGEVIEAWHRDRLVHRGTVSSTLEEIDLFWIIDSRTGARRLLDLEQLSIKRVPVGKPAAAVAMTKEAAVGKLLPAATRKREPASAVGNRKPAAAVAERKPAVSVKPKPPASLRQVAFIEAG